MGKPGDITANTTCAQHDITIVLESHPTRKLLNVVVVAYDHGRFDSVGRISTLVKAHTVDLPHLTKS